MAQNTEAITLDHLKIKYSPEFPITRAHAEKLRRALEIATRALRRSIELLRPIEDAAMLSPQALAELPYIVLRLHFHFPKLESLGPQHALRDKGWNYAVLKIGNNLRQIELGLKRPVVIADTQAATVGREVARALAQFDREFNEGDFSSPTERTFYRDTFQLKAMREGVAKAAGTRGDVAVKKSVQQTMSPADVAKYQNKDPSVRLAPEQLGSIHVNFSLLLKEQSVNEVSVARTIIHEASHKFCSTSDFAYAINPDYANLTASQSLGNADSYAYAAVSLYKGHLFRNDAGMAQPPAGIDMNS
jgi:hypothetical protein